MHVYIYFCNIIFYIKFYKITMNKISVIIHTYNNEKIIAECLEAVKDFDEIIICDMYSSDKTLEIAKKYNCKIVMHEKTEIVEPARNFAISQASNEWVLIVDSDEIISEELKNYLFNFVKSNTKYSAIKFPRINYYWNIALEMQYPDYIIRFAKKSDIFWPKEIHSQPKISGEIYTIPKEERNLAFIHYRHSSPTDYIATMNKYTDQEVQKFINSNKKKPFMPIAIWKSFFLIIEKFILKKGYKNGIDGLIISILFGFYKFLTYTKYYVYLNEKEKETKNKNK